MSLHWFGSEQLRNYLAPRTPDNVDAVVVEQLTGRPSGQGAGIAALQRFWRETRSLAPILIYSFEAQEALAHTFPLVQHRSSEITFLQAPFSRAKFEAALAELLPMTPETLAYLLRWYGGLQEEWREDAHALGHLLSDWPLQSARFREILQPWNERLRLFAPDQSGNWKQIETALDGNAADIRLTLQALEQGLCSQPVIARSLETEVLPPALFPRPPVGFDSIAIGDDHGYEEATIGRLRRYGYIVYPAARDLEQARSVVLRARPRVFLADLHFPTREAGAALVTLALQAPSIRLVIAVSKSQTVANGLPMGVENSCGAYNHQDGERIHRLIWRRAQREGVQQHV